MSATLSRAVSPTLLEPDRDRAAGRRVLDGVVEQIRQGLRQQLAIAEDLDRATRLADQAQLAFVGGRLVQLADVAHDRCEVHRLERAAIGAGLHSRDAQQRVECLEHLVELPHALGEILVARLRGGGQHLESIAQARERAAQIVRDAVGYVPHAGQEILDLVEHRIHVARELVVLVVAAVQRRAPAQVAGYDLARRAVQLGQPALRAQRHQQSAHERERRAPA